VKGEWTRNGAKQIEETGAFLFSRRIFVRRNLDDDVKLHHLSAPISEKMPFFDSH
jgi:hypothetical protein